MVFCRLFIHSGWAARSRLFAFARCVEKVPLCDPPAVLIQRNSWNASLTISWIWGHERACNVSTHMRFGKAVRILLTSILLGVKLTSNGFLAICQKSRLWKAAKSLVNIKTTFIVTYVCRTNIKYEFHMKVIICSPILSTFCMMICIREIVHIIVTWNWTLVFWIIQG